MDKLNFFFLLVCIIGLFIGLVKANGRISKLKGMVESLLIREDKDYERKRRNDGSTL